MRWLKLISGRCKLNFDGISACNYSPYGAGGVIKDDKSVLLLAFSVGFRNNDVELRSVLHGLKFCNQLGITALDVETDSKLDISWLLRKRCGKILFLFL